MIMKLEYKWYCKYCEYIGKSRRDLQKHHKEIHNFTRYNFPAWNKGLTKENDERILNLSKKVSKSLIGKPGHPVSEETKNKIRNTNKIKHSMGGYRKGSGRGKKGWYKGYFCDSSWELAFVIYNLDHGITDFSKNFNEKFEYEINGEKHLYIPDFKFSDGHFIEVKGRRETDPIIEAKRNTVKNIKILFADDMKPYLDYVISKYGENFINLYELKL